MKRICFIGILFVACVSHDQAEEERVSDGNYRDQVKLEVKYAQGFDFEYSEGLTKVISHSISDNEAFSNELYILHREDSSAKSNRVLPYELKRLACMSSTHLAYLDVLNELESVTGLCGMKYISDDSVKKILDDAGAEELCLSESVQLEPLLNADPDLFLNYPFGISEQKDFEEKGIMTFLIAEYLEESQLARLEWIKLFGMLVGKPNEAQAYFDRVEKSYNSLKTEPDPNKKFIMNVPFGEQWFMPSSKSVGVQLMEDAGLQYYFQDDQGTENILHSKEEVWKAGFEANYWIIIAQRPAGFTIDDLVAEESVYTEFKSVKNQQVIFCNTATTDYFAKGVVEPDVLLKDLLFLTHQISDHEPKYFFRLE